MTDRVRLTPKERRVYRFLRQEIGRRKRSPTFREIAKHCGFTSRTSSGNYLDRLEAKGLLTRERGRPRSIRLIRRPVGKLPFLGRISAGGLTEAIENKESLDLGAIVNAEGRTVLQVTDDTLMGLDIAPGSYPAGMYRVLRPRRRAYFRFAL